MSAGKFVVSKYESNELGVVMPVRLQEESLVFAAGEANTPPDEAVSLGLFAHVSKNRGAYGVGCRKIAFRWVDEAPDGYDPGGVLTLPILKLSTYVAYVPGTTGTYLGEQIVVISRIPENAK